MKRSLLLVLAVLVPFGALVAWGLSQLDRSAPATAPAAAHGPPSALDDLPFKRGPSFGEEVARALPKATAQPGQAQANAPGPHGLPNVTIGTPPVVAELPPSQLEAQAAEVAARPRPISALGKETGTVLVPPPRLRQTPQVVESVMKNGFPPKVEAAARALTAHCWADNAARAPGPVQVTVLARPTTDGRYDQTRVSYSSWSDPIFMACVEDAIAEGSFPTGDRLPPAPVLQTLEFGAAQ